MIRVVVDTNVLVSAVRRGTTTRRVAEAWIEGKVRLVVSRGIVQEYLRVLGYPKLRLTREEIRKILEEAVLPYAETVAHVPALPHPPPGVEKDDVKFLACAAAGKARYLITGDKVLLKTARFHSVEIVSPAGFLAVLE